MLNRIYLNHAPGLRFINQMGYVLLLTGASAGIALFITAQHFNQRRASLEQDIDQLRQPLVSNVSRNDAGDGIKHDEFAAVKAVMAELALPWQTLFKTLESINIPDVKLVSVEPNARQHKLRMTAEATNTQTMLEYVETLEKQAIFADVFLMTHERTEGGAMPIRFVVEATWKS
ncbi:MAG: hypothetical protein ACAH12_02060 [Methylophilaceae bacterium]